MSDGRWLRSDTSSRGGERGNEHEPVDLYAHPKRGHYLTSAAAADSFSISATAPLSSSRPPLPHQSGAGSRSNSAISNGHQADPYNYMYADVKGDRSSSSPTSLYTTIPIMPTTINAAAADPTLSAVTYRTAETQLPPSAYSRVAAVVAPNLLTGNTAYRHCEGPNPNRLLRVHREAALPTALLAVPPRVPPSSSGSSYSSLCDWDRLQRYVSAIKFKDPSRYPYLPNFAHHGGGMGLAPELGDTEDLLAVHADVLRFGKDCDPSSLEAQSNIPCPPPPIINPEYRDKREELYGQRAAASQSVASSVLSSNSAKNGGQNNGVPSRGIGVNRAEAKQDDNDDSFRNRDLLPHSEGERQRDQRNRGEGADREEVRKGGDAVGAGSMTEAEAQRYHTHRDAVASRAVKAAARVVAAAVVSTTTPSPSPVPVGQSTSRRDHYRNNNTKREEGEEREEERTALHEREVKVTRPDGNMGRRQSFSERGGDEDSTRSSVLPRTTEAKLQEQYEALKREYEELKARGAQGQGQGQGQGRQHSFSGGARAGMAGMGMGRTDTSSSSPQMGGGRDTAVRDEEKGEQPSTASGRQTSGYGGGKKTATSGEESTRSATTIVDSFSSVRGALTRTESGGKKTRVYTVGTNSSSGPSSVKTSGHAVGSSRSVVGKPTPEEGEAASGRGAGAAAPHSAASQYTVGSGSSPPTEASVSSATRHPQKDSFSSSVPRRVDPTSHSFSFLHGGEKEKKEQEEEVRYGYDYSQAAAANGDSNYHHHFEEEEDRGERRSNANRRGDGPLLTSTAAIMEQQLGASPTPSGAPETTITTVSTVEQPLILDIVLGGEAYAIPVYNGDRVDRVMETFQHMREERWREKQGGGGGGDLPPPLTDRQWKRLELTISAVCGSSSDD